MNASGITREVIANVGTDIKLEIIFSYFDSSQNLSFLRLLKRQLLNPIQIRLFLIIFTRIKDLKPKTTCRSALSSVNDIAMPLIYNPSASVLERIPR